MSDKTKYTDQELTTLVKSGCRKAFKELYERYWALLIAHAQTMVRDQDEAKDIVQDVFIMFWEKAPTIEIHTSVSSFLYTSTRFAILNKIRHYKVSQAYLSALQNRIEQGDCTIEENIIERELKEKFEAELKKLPAKMRQVFELSRIHEYSYREISETLKISDNTVKRQISNALKIMRTKLSTILFSFF